MSTSPFNRAEWTSTCVQPPRATDLNIVLTDAIRHGLPMPWAVLVTETAIVLDVHRLAGVMQWARRMGVQVETEALTRTVEHHTCEGLYLDQVLVRVRCTTEAVPHAARAEQAEQVDAVSIEVPA